MIQKDFFNSIDPDRKIGSPEKKELDLCRLRRWRRSGRRHLCTLIETCEMNDVDPQAWFADVLAGLRDHPAGQVADLLPWTWKANQQSKTAAAA